MNATNQRGFSLQELAIVIVIMGLVLASSVPAYRSFRESSALKSAKENIAGELRLAREKAIAIGSQQEIHFSAGYAGADYHIHNDGVVGVRWSLPDGIQYYWGFGTNWSYRLERDGRSLDSGMIILQDPKGNRDTVSVMTSGLILTR